MHLMSPFKQEYGDAIHYCIQCNAASARAFWDSQRPGVCGKDMEAQPGSSLLLPEACPRLSADSGNCEPHLSSVSSSEARGQCAHRPYPK